MEGFIWDYNKRTARLVNFLDQSAPEKIDKGTMSKYSFNPITVYITKDCYDEEALHYSSKNIKKFTKGQEVIIDGVMQNFYGKYYSVVIDGKHYGVKAENITFTE